MIDYYNGQLTDIMPVNMRNEQTIAISYSVQKALQKLLNYVETCAIYGALEKMPDHILDLMAIELRTQYYNQNAPRKIRETMISKTMEWYMKGGTGSVLAEYLATVYGGGGITEWYEYNGEPYHFKAMVLVDETVSVPIEECRKIIEKITAYKNVRSWLEALILKMDWFIQWDINYSNRICIRGMFYPRYNLNYHHLAGCHKLDGSKMLNGYSVDDLIDFYPLKIKIKGDTKVIIEPCAMLRNTGQVNFDTKSDATIHVIADAAEKLSGSESAEILSDVIAKPTYVSSLTVEKNLRYLDGTGYLDGTNLLNADITTHTI